LLFRRHAQPGSSEQLSLLADAERVLGSASAIAESDRHEAMAAILRAKAELLAKTSHFAEVEKTIVALGQLVTASPNDTKIQQAYEGAQGAVLVYEQHYSD